MPLISAHSSRRSIPSLAGLAFALAVLLATPTTHATTLPEALDQPGITVTSSGDQPWTFQSDTTHDGLDAARSGAITHAQFSAMEATVNGPGTVSFWWKVSSEDGKDTLAFAANGLVRGSRISGEVDWQQVKFTLFPGSHNLRWTYVKNSSGSAGLDAAWIDRLVIPDDDPGAVMPASRQSTITPGTSTSLTVPPAIGLASYQWFEGPSGDDSHPVPGATASLLVTPVRWEPTTYWVRITGSSASIDSQAATITIGPPTSSRLLATGSNYDGQLGDGTNTSRSLPALMDTNVANAIAGPRHSLVIKTDGSLWTTGYNHRGQLGDGSTEDRATPIQIAENVATAAAGTDFSLFVKSDGTLWGMGSNGYGSLGLGDAGNLLTPTQIATDVLMAAGGNDHAHFIKTDHTLWSMGNNVYGQLGKGEPFAEPTPIQIEEDVIMVEAGSDHSFFIKTDGTLWAMGGGTLGQLGTGRNANESSPIQIATGVATVSTGISHTVFVKTDGTLWATGSNNSGQLGTGNTTDQTQPVQIATDVRHAAAGGFFTMFVKADDTLWATGSNPVGALGDGTTEGKLSPVQVAVNVADISTGSAFSLIRDFVPAVVDQPQQTGVPAGGTAILSFTASGPGPLTYQWFRGPSGDTSDVVPGAASPTLNLTPEHASFTYWVRVSNNYGAADSEAAEVILVHPPTIMSAPPSQEISPGENVNLSVAAEGGLLTYQWYAGQVDDTSSPLPAGSRPLVVSPPLWETPSFWVRVSNAAGTVDASAPVSFEPPVPARLLATGRNSAGQHLGGALQDVTSPQLAETEVTQIAAGNQHSLCIRTDRSLWAAGDNFSGQLGDGTTTTLRIPIKIAGQVAMASAGQKHSLFVLDGGALMGMGSNSDGQLGDGTTTDRHSPVTIATAVVMATAGADFSLFLKSDRTLWAMGRNEYGQLGDGTTENRTTPVEVASDVTMATAGGDHAMFTKTDGSLWTMGYNLYGQLGDGTTENRSTPVQIASPVATASAGGGHSHFVKMDGTLWGMGSNSSGRLGDGTNSQRREPVQITDEVRTVSAGAQHSHFIKLDRSLWAMGENYYGRLGDGSTTDRFDPVLVAEAVASVSAGGSHTLIRDLLPSFTTDPSDVGVPAGGSPVLNAGAVGAAPLSYQWYAGASGDTSIPLSGATTSTLQLPPATESGSYWLRVSNPFGNADSRTAQALVVTVPVVTSEPQPIEISSGQPAHFRVSSEGGMLNYQWYQGLTGDTSRPVPGAVASLLVTHPLVADASFWVRITNAAGTTDSQGTTATIVTPFPAQLKVMGRNATGTLGDGTNADRSLPVTLAKSALTAAGGNAHTLFIRNDGSLWATGQNVDGQLGIGEPSHNHFFPIHVSDGTAQVAAGNSHSLFIDQDGVLWGMGDNEAGQLGDGTTTPRASPVRIADDVVQVTSGYAHSLFIRSDRSLWTMGKNSSGQLGIEDASNQFSPRQLITNVVHVAAGSNHTLFVTADGTLWAMGYNQVGQLGDGSSETRHFPVAVASGVVAAAAGNHHSLFIKADGSVWATGSNSFGQLGDGTENTSFSPIQITDNVISIAAGSYHSLVLKDDHTLWTTGSNQFGQLGDESGPERSTLAQVATAVADIAAGDFHSFFRNLVPVVLELPAPLGVLTGATPTLSVQAGGATPLSYQWFAGPSGDDSQPVTGAVTASLTTTPITTPSEFWVRITNQFGIIDSHTYQVSPATQPVITAAPDSHAQPSGGTTILDVSATGGTLGYQWFAGPSGDTSTPIEGATSSVLVMPPATASASFWVRVTNTAGSTDSGTAEITITPPTAFNLRTMGDNTFGQLGNGTSTVIPNPVPVLKDVASVACGGAHTLFTKTDRTLWAMGDNSRGQLGDGTTETRTAPVQIASGVAGIAAGTLRSVFTKSDRSLWAMGYGYGVTPVRVATDIIKVAAADSALAYLNQSGHLTIKWEFQTTTVSGVRDFATGPNHALIIKTDHSLWAVGNNTYGQLGVGSAFFDIRSPVRITDDVDQVTTSQRHSMFVKHDGTLWAMGDSMQGALGVGNTNPSRLSPVEIARDVSRVHAGNSFSFFVNTGGVLHATGSNQHGQLGDGSMTDRFLPVRIGTPPKIVQISTGAHSSCFVDAHGYLWVCGENTSGHLGLPSPPDHTTPAHIANGITMIAAGDEHSLLLASDGTVRGMGSNASGQLGPHPGLFSPAPVSVATDVALIAAGSNHSLMLKHDATLWTVGDNTFGQLGDGTTESRRTPVQVASGVASIAAGRHHSLFLKHDGTLWGAGSNTDGQLGLSSSEAQPTPVLLASEVGAIAAGDHYSLVLKTDGSLRVSGANTDGQLGIGNTDNQFAPVEIAKHVTGIACGASHSLFHTSNGDLWTMGNNDDGQLGDGTNDNQSTPVPISTDVVAIAGGHKHSMFVQQDGSLRAVGDNSAGQLGDGSRTSRNTPVLVSTNATAITAGGSHSLVLTPDGGSLPTAIPTPPVSRDVTPGGSSTLQVEAIGPPPLTYQWFEGITGDLSHPVPAATTSTFTSPPIDSRAAYWVRITSASGASDSPAAMLTAIPAPEIPDAPAPRGAPIGGHAVLSVPNASNQRSYQWFEGESGDDSRPVPGATAATLVTPPLIESTRFWVRLSTSTGTADSASATVTVPAVSGHILRFAGDGYDSPPTFIDHSVAMASVGNSHVLFVESNGSLWAQGSNAYGQLGDGTTIDRSPPIQIAGNVCTASAGRHHTLFIRTDRSLWGMGRNTDGQLGDGTFDTRITPVHIADDVVIASAGSEHSLFLKSDRSLWAMGGNRSGQLGDGTRTSHAIPVKIADNVASICAGEVWTLFTKTDGTLWATGNNSRNQLGTGTTNDQLVPALIAEGVARASTGYQHSLFVKTDGTLWGMGESNDSQLGTVNWRSRIGFSRPGILATDVTHAEAGSGHSLFRKSDDSLWALGSNRYGQLIEDEAYQFGSATQVAIRTHAFSTGWNLTAILTNSSPHQPPAITTHPAPDLVESGTAANLHVSAIGDAPLSYQWYEGQSGDTSNVITGATKANLTTSPLVIDTSYWVRVSNPASRTYSRTATVSVFTPPQEFLAWADGHGLGGVDALLHADPDHDHLTNLMEFGLNTHPLLDSNARQPTGSAVSGPDDRHVSITHRQRLGTGLTFSYQTSDDLLQWTDIAPVVEIVDADIDGDGSTALVRAIHPVPPAQTTAFLRLIITSP